MKTVGIITFHRAKNYGAVLQAYALQKILRELNVGVKVIDYRKSKVELDYKPLALKKYKNQNVMSVAKGLCKEMLMYRPIKVRRYQNFLKTNIDCTQCFYTGENIAEVGDCFDLYITGSDQVWNNVCTGFDTTYFLDFVKEDKKKASYAASFAFEQIKDELIPEYKKLLMPFRYISVREKSGVEIVRKVLGREAVLTLDPTLLLCKEEWCKIAIEPRVKQYILVYTMFKSETLLRYVNELSIKTGLQVVFIDLGMMYSFKKNRVVNAGPAELLGYFLNAEYVVTNSFHGLVLSINFNKKFFLERQAHSGASNTRLENMIEMFQLQDRLIINGENKRYTEDIDYHKTNLLLEAQRRISMNYLAEIVS